MFRIIFNITQILIVVTWHKGHKFQFLEIFKITLRAIEKNAPLRKINEILCQFLGYQHVDISHLVSISWTFVKDASKALGIDSNAICNQND